jgi:WD40 repeat protein
MHRGDSSVGGSQTGRAVDSTRHPTAEIWRLSYLKAGKVIASADDHEYCCLWDAETHKQIAKFKGPTGYMAASPSPDGETLALLDYDRRLFLLNADGKTEPTEIAALGAKGRAIAWSPDGKRLAMGGRSHSVTIWDRKTRTIQEVTMKYESVDALCWLADSKTLVIGSDSRAITF